MLTFIFGLLSIWLCLYLLKMLVRSTFSSIGQIFKLSGTVFNSRKVIRKKFRV